MRKLISNYEVLKEYEPLNINLNPTQPPQLPHSPQHPEPPELPQPPQANLFKGAITYSI